MKLKLGGLGVVLLAMSACVGGRTTSVGSEVLFLQACTEACGGSVEFVLVQLSPPLQYECRCGATTIDTGTQP